MKPAAREQGFDETTYLRLNPDVLVAVRAGKFSSGREHYEHYGRAEGRLALPSAVLPRDRILVTTHNGITPESPTPYLGVMDQIKLSPLGGLFIAGWVDDTLDPLETIELYVAGWAIAFSATTLARSLRPDTDEVTKLPTPRAVGFHGFFYAAQKLSVGQCTAVMRLRSGAELSLIATITLVDDDALRKTALSYLAAMTYPGPQDFGVIAMLARGMGAQLVEFSRMLSRRAVKTPAITRLHQPGRQIKASVISCISAGHVPFSLQLACLARQPGAQDYEFIYVCADPTQAEALLAEAEMAHLVYGLDLTLVLFEAPAGWAAAKNTGAGLARSKNLLFLETGMLPKTPDFARGFLALGATSKAILGAQIHDANGAPLQRGVRLKIETRPGFTVGVEGDISLLRVERHPQATRLIAPPFVAIPAILFEKLQGFSENYAFGGGEEIDLCLRAIQAGQPPQLSDLAFEHVVPGTGKDEPQFRGERAIRAWQLTSDWLGAVRAGIER